MLALSTVIPAKAGIQELPHARLHPSRSNTWVPAFAGTT